MTDQRDRDNESEGAQIRAHLLRLTTHIEQVEAHLEDALEDVQRTSEQVDVLVRRLTDPDATHASDERIAEMLSRLDAAQEQLGDLADNVSKLRRTQFKANTLTETQSDQLSSALETLQEIATRREERQDEQAAARHRQIEETRRAARGEVAADMLPVLAGIEMALASGRTLLLRQQEAAHSARASHDGVLRRLQWALSGTPTPTASPSDTTTESLSSWLDGLELVRDRCLALLAAENIEPIQAEGEHFDPRRHVAVETEVRDDAPADTVVAVQRAGYRQGDRVLRYAEVVVARPPDERDDE